MNHAPAYWSQLFEVVRPLRCWVRLTCRDDDATGEGYWGQTLLMPVDTYLEGPGGPWPLRDVKWVDVSLSYLKGGMAGQPLQILDDRKDEILSCLRETQLDWDVREATWSIEGLFEVEPVQLVRVINPFFEPPPRR